MPPTGSRSRRSLSRQIVPPLAIVWCTAGSRPSSRCSVSVPSSGHCPAEAESRPQAGHCQASCCAFSSYRRTSIRASDAASSVSLQPGGGTSAATGLLPPALDDLGFLPRPGLLEERARELEQLGRARMRLGARPADDGALRLLREQLLELGARLLGGDDRSASASACVRTRRSSSSATSRRCSPTSFSMCRWKRACDQPPWSCLPGTSSLLVGDLVQPAGPQAIELTSLTTDDRDDRSFTAADERHERREMELSADPDAVGNRLDERARPPDVVEAGGEDREPVGAVADEVVLEEVADAREVLLQRQRAARASSRGCSPRPCVRPRRAAS